MGINMLCCNIDFGNAENYTTFDFMVYFIARACYHLRVGGYLRNEISNKTLTRPL